MRRLNFHGYKNAFGEYGIMGDNVDSCGDLEPIQCVIDCGKEGRLMVIGQYFRRNGCWMVGISKVEESDTFPDWRISCGYCAEVHNSPKLCVEVPENFKLIWYRNGEKIKKYIGKIYYTMDENHPDIKSGRIRDWKEDKKYSYTETYIFDNERYRNKSDENPIALIIHYLRLAANDGCDPNFIHNISFDIHQIE